MPPRCRPAPTRPRYLSAMRPARGASQYRQRNSLDASEFEEHYWGRWFYPINVLALCLAAVPFAFGTLRSGGMGKRLFIGIVFALGFWLLQTQFVKLAHGVQVRLPRRVPAADGDHAGCVGVLVQEAQRVDEGC